MVGRSQRRWWRRRRGWRATGPTGKRGAASVAVGCGCVVTMVDGRRRGLGRTVGEQGDETAVVTPTGGGSDR